MNLTRNRFRILCGVAAALAGAALLLSIRDSLYATITFAKPVAPGWTAGGRIFGAGLALLVVGIGSLFEFASDPPPRKDPWQ